MCINHFVNKNYKFKCCASTDKWLITRRIRVNEWRNRCFDKRRDKFGNDVNNMMWLQQNELVPFLLTMSSTPAGTTMGLKESECGQMGVTMMAGTLGWIMEAPAAAAYAVLPVGVDTITPGRQRKDLTTLINSSLCPCYQSLYDASVWDETTKWSQKSDVTRQEQACDWTYHLPALRWWAAHRGTSPHWTGRRTGLGPPPPHSIPAHTHRVLKIRRENITA